MLNAQNLPSHPIQEQKHDLNIQNTLHGFFELYKFNLPNALIS